MVEFEVNENSTCWLNLQFYGRDNQLVAPSSLTYQVDCLTTGTSMKASTVLTPATNVEIELTTAINAINSQTNAYERRRVLVTTDKDTQRYTYRVRNLGGVT